MGVGGRVEKASGIPDQNTLGWMQLEHLVSLVKLLLLGLSKESLSLPSHPLLWKSALSFLFPLGFPKLLYFLIHKVLITKHSLLFYSSPAPFLTAPNFVPASRPWLEY